jgi:phage terminase large subunit
VNLIRTLPQVQRDEKDPNDVATEPHELTHAPDALRYFCSMRTRPSVETAGKQDMTFDFMKPKPDAFRGGKVDKSYIEGGWD